MLPSPQLKEVTVRDYLVIFKRRSWVILACFIVVTFWFVFQTYKKIPQYSATAKVLVERNTPSIMPGQQLMIPSQIDREYIQSQLNILTSRTLAKRAVDSLALAGDNSFVKIKEPENAFLGGVSVNLISGTQLINIGYISTDPIKAAKYANILTTEYIGQDSDKRLEFGKSAAGWLEKQVVEARKKLKGSEDALSVYMQQNSIVAVPDIDRRQQSGLENAKSEKSRIESELAELSKRYKSQHPKIIAITTRLESVNKVIEEETNKSLVLNEKMMQYNSLKREVESDKNMYESLVRRTKESEISKDLETTNLRIIDMATVPKSPFSPNRRRDIQTGMMLGLFLGVGMAFFLEYLDSSVKTAEDVELYVKLPFLGYVPSAKQEVKLSKDPRDIDLICSKMPNSRVAEAYRSIRTSIIFSCPEDRSLKTILITSTSPREGKSTVSTNLGIVFANANEKTVILEADMRRPRLAHTLGVEGKEGLSTFLTGASDLDAVIKKTEIPNLFLIPSGPRPPNPAELLTSSKTRNMLTELKTRFDRIIIDSPPVLTVADPAIMANMAEGVIDVILSNALNIDIILKGRQRLYEAKAKIIGIILNNVNVKKEDSYYYYHYYYAEEKEKKS